jgi:hypothetical protein
MPISTLFVAKFDTAAIIPDWQAKQLDELDQDDLFSACRLNSYL